MMHQVEKNVNCYAFAFENLLYSNCCDIQFLADAASCHLDLVLGLGLGLSLSLGTAGLEKISQN